MKNLEERIYRDATKIAAEIAHEDIPALRLTHSAGSAQERAAAAAWSGTTSRSPGRRTLTALAAAASIAVVASVLVLIGHRPAVQTGPAFPPAVSSGHPTPRGPQPDPKLRKEALDWYFPASGPSYTAGLAFAWTQDKLTARDIDPCLASAGFPQPAFHGSLELYQLSFASQQFPDLKELAAHPGQHYFTGQYPVVNNPTQARMKLFDRAQKRCTARFAQSVTRVDKAAAALQSAWLSIVSGIESSPEVKATQPGFAKCIERHGVPASFATMTTNASDPLFHGFNAWADSTSQAATSKQELAASQRKEARVFLACAGPVASTLARVQLPRRAQFFEQHAGQIARIGKLAEQLQ